MAITIELPPEVEARLSEMAELHGVDLTTYAKHLLQGSVIIPPPQGTATEQRASFDAFLATISQFSENIPDLPDYAFTRESFYEADEQ